MTSYTDKLDQIAELKTTTAGALPGTRTFAMVEEAIESGDTKALAEELLHSRAHYQSLEYMLHDEKRTAEVINEAIEEGILPRPETPAEMQELTIRFIATVVLMSGYDLAHQVGYYSDLTQLSLQEAFKAGPFAHLDWSDPQRDVTDEELEKFLNSLSDDAGGQD